ncbi:hypothetical protein NKR19_g6302 [Coniochaeta hoffmannii]|uniref:Uncharacterized protein n=1 Tax=Coniochaeta hoffmannii TaxID=91930 RepID=A0AA38VQB7_9PEZI|nr:hypothetical protein NKR19_g6302 [Coniochaeta hoffmannii]
MDTIIGARDIEASWHFYQRTFPKAWYQLHRGRSRSFSMCLQKHRVDPARSWQLPECTEILVVGRSGVDQRKAARPETEADGKKRDVVGILISFDTQGLGVETLFLYSAPVFPEITRITNALLGSPWWRVIRTWSWSH